MNVESGHEYRLERIRERLGGQYNVTNDTFRIALEVVSDCARELKSSIDENTWSRNRLSKVISFATVVLALAAAIGFTVELIGIETIRGAIGRFIKYAGEYL